MANNVMPIAINTNSANISDLTSTLDNSFKRNTGHFDAIVASLDASARDLNRTADHVAGLATDPQLRANIQLQLRLDVRQEQHIAGS